jgi:V8-like Glu-specific endopeptidase
VAWNNSLTALNYVLAGLYPFPSESYRMVTEAGIPPQFVAFREKAIDTWYEILRAAETRGKVIDLVRVALKEHPEHSVLIQAAKGDLTQLTAPTVGKDLTWKGDLSVDTVEKIMSTQSTFLPVNFLETGLLRARAVARIKLANGELGTGFLTSNNIFVTNNHVIPDVEKATSATIQFNYQQSAKGLDLEPTNLRLDPAKGFKTSTEDDWTFIRVSGDANADWGVIEMEEIDVSKTERVNIIQHPSGGPKQIAIYHNVVAYTDEKRVQYLTDTLPGSSGSPVFDNQWRLVALHHSGGWILEPQSKSHVFRNEGININRVLKELNQSF